MYSLKDFNKQKIEGSAITNNRANVSTAFTKRTINQSPKITSNNMNKVPMKSDSEIHPYFSLIDIKPQFYSKGPSFPKQYIRPSTHAPFNSKNFNSRQNFEKFEKENKDAYDDIGSFPIENIKVEKQDQENDNNENKENKEKVAEDKKMILSKTSRDINIINVDEFNTEKSPSTNNRNVNNKALLNEKSTSYSRIRPTSHHPFIPSIKEYSNILKKLNDPVVLRKQRQAVHDIKVHAISSDIFFNKPVANQPKIDISNKSQNSSLKKDYMDSDIFALKNNYLSLNKIGETYLKRQTKKVYTGTTESNSAWAPNNTHKNLFNHESTFYHPLNPGIRNICPTRDDIEKETGNASFKAKGLFEFADLSRVSAPNLNKKFKEAIQSNPNAFNKNTNLCSSFRDLHGEYRDLCDKPFYKKF